MRHLSFFIIIILSIAFCHAQTTIRGYVYTGNQGLEFATVSATDSLSGKLIGGVITDKTGRYIIKDLPYGTYQLEASFIPDLSLGVKF